MTPTQTQADLNPCPDCKNEYLAIRTDIYKDKREFVYCDCCGCIAPRSVWNRIAATASIAPSEPAEWAPPIGVVIIKDGEVVRLVQRSDLDQPDGEYSIYTGAAPQLPASTEPAPRKTAMDNLRESDPNFAAHLEQSSREVATWPDWKKLPAPAEPMPSPSAITAWLETPDGKAAVMRAYAKLQADIAGLNEARAVSHADLNEPMSSTASEDERALFEAAARACRYFAHDFKRFGDGADAMPRHYLYIGTQSAWELWQARAALAKPSTIASAENSQDQQKCIPPFAEPAGQLDATTLTDDEIDALTYPPKASLKREDWNPLTHKPYPETVERLLKAVKTYASHWMQDEAEPEDDPDDLVCTPDQHIEAVEVFAAIAAVEAAVPVPRMGGNTNERLRDEYHREFSTSWMYGGKVGLTIPTFDDWKAKRAAATPSDAAKGGGQ